MLLEKIFDVLNKAPVRRVLLFLNAAHCIYTKIYTNMSNMMEKSDREKLRLLTTYLIRDLNVTVMLIAYLEEHKILTQEMKQDIAAKPTPNDKTRCLLDLLPKRGPDAMRHFIDGLREDDQRFVADSLERSLEAIRATRNQNSASSNIPGNREQHSMSATDRDTLRNNKSFLVSDLYVSTTLLAYLNEKGILNDSMENDITGKQSREGKASTLIARLTTRGPEAFQGFIEALRSDQQIHIANRLDPQGMDQLDLPAPVQVNEKSDDESTDEIMEIRVQPSDTKLPQVQQLMQDLENNYKMTSSPRGVALIINNDFSDGSRQNERCGALNDNTNLDTFFQAMGFQTELCFNETREDIKREIETLIGGTRLQGVDCFVLFALSHGHDGVLLDSEGTDISIQSDLEAPFYECEHLQGKPKVFFIQACRNVKDDKPIVPKDQNAADDIFRYYPTIPGFEAQRHRDLGSPFARTIIHVFSKYACSDDLKELMRKVSQKMKNNYNVVTEEKCSTTKKLYFFPVLDN